MKYLAATLPGGLTIEAPNDIPQGGLSTLDTILGNGITLFIIAGTILALIYLAWGGINMITSRGDKSKLQSAQGKITWAIIGLILLFSSFFIISIVSYLFDVELLRLGY